MGHLGKIDDWAEQLGLLPVPMFGDQSKESQKYVLLNGTKGNFCLDLESTDPTDAPPAAWSANVGHYVNVTGSEKLRVQRWDRPAASEQFSLSSVAASVERFHKYLEENEPNSELSVVAHTVKVFRRLRTVLGTSDSSVALGSFLYLLASAAEAKGNKPIEMTGWNLPDEALQGVERISATDWETLYGELTHSGAYEQLTLEPKLLLRHAAGPVFQEAHYEAVFFNNNQLRFQGFAPEPAKILAKTQSMGIHFTPPALARTLIEQALAAADLSKKTITIFDPACGSGEFLREALRQLRLRGFHGKVKLVGRDISSPAVLMANFLLGWEQRHDQHGTEVVISKGDSLDPGYMWPSDVDVLAMNPPFISYEDLSDDQIQIVYEILGDLRHGRVDLSLAFLWRAVSSLRQGCILATLIPASFLESDAASRIRAEMARRVSATLVARLGSHVLFPNAIIDAAMYVCVIGEKHETDTLAFWADHRPSSSSLGLRELRKLGWRGGSAHEPILGEGFSIYVANDLVSENSNWAPRPFSSWRFLQSLTNFPEAGDLFEIKSGSRSGDIKSFVIDKDEYLTLPAKERCYFRPAVINESIVDGKLNDAKYVFYPYGEYSISDEGQLAKNLRTFYQKFRLAKPNLLQRASKLKAAKWWEMSESRNWQHHPEPKLVSVYFGDAGSFGWDSSGSFVVLSGFAWLPKDTLKPRGVFPKKMALAYLSILNSAVMSELLSATSRPVQGGQWDLSNRYLKHVRMPNLANDFDSILVAKLAEFGERLQLGKPVDASELEETVRSTYGAPSQKQE